MHTINAYSPVELQKEAFLKFLNILYSVSMKWRNKTRFSFLSPMYGCKVLKSPLTLLKGHVIEQNSKIMFDIIEEGVVIPMLLHVTGDVLYRVTCEFVCQIFVSTY